MGIRVVLAAFVAALVACAGGSTASPPAPEPTEEQDAPVELVVTEGNAPVEVSAGRAFDLRVESNPSVGYEWEVIEPGDADVLEHEGFYYVDEGEDPAPGASVLVDYRFTGVAPGTTTVVLQRRYRGDVEDPPVERRHEVTVTQ